MSWNREARLDSAHATYKASVTETEQILKAIERKRARVLEDIEAVQAQRRAFPNCMQDSDDYASYASTEARLWQFIYLLDGQARSVMKAQDKARAKYCRALEDQAQ